MRHAATLQAFVADRFGQYVVGRHYLMWCVDRTLGGIVFWGIPDENDVAELLEAFAIEPHEPYDVVTDGRRLEHVARAAFDPFARQALAKLTEQRPLLRRHALVAPFGLIGTVMSGFFSLFRLPDEHRVFTETNAAFAWLGRADVMATVEHLVEGVVGEGAVVTELRRWLAQHFREPNIEDAAHALKRSSRTLQRELRQAATSFRSEVERARVTIVQARLIDSDDKLATIAHDIGSASGQSVATMFRRLVGETPTEYRDRMRAGKPRK